MAGAILILSYNKPSLAEACLRSALEAGYAENRLHLIDNGSSPQLDPGAWGFKNVTVFRLNRNHGYSGGVEAGLRELFRTGHEAVMVLTNDTRIQAGAVEACMACAARLGSGLIAPAVRRMGDPGRLESLGGRFDRITCSLEHAREPAGEGFLGEDSYVPGSAFWISRECWDATGGLDTDYHTYWEDVDFSFRARELGILLARCPGATVLHAGGLTCRKKPRYGTFYFLRNRVRFCRRHLRPEEKAAARIHLEREINHLESVWMAAGDQRRLPYVEPLRAELIGL